MSRSLKVSYENFVASKVFDRQYVNNHNGNVREIMGTKTVCLANHIF